MLAGCAAKGHRNDVWHLDDVVVSIGGRGTGIGEPSIKTAARATKSPRRGAKTAGFKAVDRALVSE